MVKLISARKLTAALLISMWLVSTGYAQLGNAPMPKERAEKPTGPTLEATTQWITQKLDESVAKFATPINGGMFRQEYRLRFRFTDCKEAFFLNDARLWREGEDYMESKSHSELFSLADLDPSSMSAYQHQGSVDWNISMSSLGKKDVFYTSQARPTVYLKPPKVANAPGDVAGYNDATAVAKEVEALRQQLRTGQGRGKAGNWFQKSVPDFETGDRLVNALKHASQLCRQQVASEKAAQPSKPKEIF